MADAYERARKLVGAGALIVDGRGAALIVRPTYKPDWEIPGGIVEADESPLSCCVRELHEELGIDVQVGRLLCIEYKHSRAAVGDSLQWIFDGGTLMSTAVAQIRLPPDELSEHRFVELDRLDGLLPATLATRLRAAALARDLGTTVYIEDGRVIAPTG